jgi:hypothetical protein
MTIRDLLHTRGSLSDPTSFSRRKESDRGFRQNSLLADPKLDRRISLGADNGTTGHTGCTGTSEGRPRFVGLHRVRELSIAGVAREDERIRSGYSVSFVRDAGETSAMTIQLYSYPTLVRPYPVSWSYMSQTAFAIDLTILMLVALLSWALSRPNL